MSAAFNTLAENAQQLQSQRARLMAEQVLTECARCDGTGRLYERGRMYGDAGSNTDCHACFGYGTEQYREVVYPRDETPDASDIERQIDAMRLAELEANQ